MCAAHVCHCGTAQEAEPPARHDRSTLHKSNMLQHRASSLMSSLMRGHQHSLATHPSGTPDHSGGSYVPGADLGAGCGTSAPPLLLLLLLSLLLPLPPAAVLSPALPSAAAAGAAASCFCCCCCAARTASCIALSRCPGVTVAAATAAMAAARLLAAAGHSQTGAGRMLLVVRRPGLSGQELLPCNKAGPY